MTTSPQFDPRNALDEALKDQAKHAFGQYLSSTPGDREALNRLKAALGNLHRLAIAIPDTLDEVQDEHETNVRAAQASQPGQAKDPHAPKSPQTAGAKG